MPGFGVKKPLNTRCSEALPKPYHKLQIMKSAL